MRTFLIATIFVMLFGFSACVNNGIKTVTAIQANEIIKTDSNAVLIDVRTVGEYAKKHIENSVNIPAFQLEVGSWVEEPEFLNIIDKQYRSTNKTLYLICKGGNRSFNATKLLIERGWDKNRVISVAKGIDFDGGWEDSNLPIVKSENEE